MTPAQLTALVRTYFTAVDTKDLSGILATLTPDCRFTVETHRVALNGQAQIEAMFTRLWRNHSSVRHHGFTFVTDEKAGRVAVRFQVENRLHDGTLVHKSNCNFFRVERDRFAEVNVYMAGENTLDTEGTQ